MPNRYAEPCKILIKLTIAFILNEIIEVVPTTGLEPVRCYSLEPESSASANSATWAT